MNPAKGSVAPNQKHDLRPPRPRVRGASEREHEREEKRPGILQWASHEGEPRRGSSSPHVVRRDREPGGSTARISASICGQARSSLPRRWRIWARSDESGDAGVSIRPIAHHQETFERSRRCLGKNPPEARERRDARPSRLVVEVDSTPSRPARRAERRAARACSPVRDGRGGRSDVVAVVRRLHLQMIDAKRVVLRMRVGLKWAGT